MSNIHTVKLTKSIWIIGNASSHRSWLAWAGYGRGALVVNGSVKNYYSSISANTGIQLGAQQYAHVLFFMTDTALNQFEYSMGFSAGGDLEYITPSISESLKVETLTTLSPVIALVLVKQD